MPTETQTRKTVWYRRYMSLAQNIEDADDFRDILRAIHRFLNGNFQYGSATVADSAGRAVEQVIQDLERR